MFAAALIATAWDSAHRDFLLYVGTFTAGLSEGIYAFRFDASTGRLSSLGLAAETDNPSFIAVHPNGRFLYAVANCREPAGVIKSFEIDPRTANLRLLNEVSSWGSRTCFVATSNGGEYVLAANYGTGSVVTFPVLPDGRLGEAAGFEQHAGSGANPERQGGPHPHSVNPSPDDRFAVAADLGLDRFIVYAMDGAAFKTRVAAIAGAPGGGPRHLAFHPSARYAYAVNELDSIVTAFTWDAKCGSLRPIQTISALPQAFMETNYAADVQVHSSGRFVYVSNRGHNSIAAFFVDKASGRLTLIDHAFTHGETPRNFTIDPTGAYLIAGNEASNDLVVFRIDPESGRLIASGERAAVFTPTCLRFVPPSNGAERKSPRAERP